MMRSASADGDYKGASTIHDSSLSASGTLIKTVYGRVRLAGLETQLLYILPLCERRLALYSLLVKLKVISQSNCTGSSFLSFPTSRAVDTLSITSLHRHITLARLLIMKLGLTTVLCLFSVLHNAQKMPHPCLDFGLNVTSAPTPLLKARAPDDKWTLSVQRGAKLLQGMQASDKEAAALYGLGETAESPFDGDLHDTLISWGWNDNTEAMQKKHDRECDMDSPTGNMLKSCFAELGLGTKSKGQGGPNECFQIEHFDGPAVLLKDDGTRPEKKDQTYKAPCGTIMRVTDASDAVGVNGIGGAVIAMNIVSPAKAAASLWRRTPLTQELPHIRSFSDISWAFWNRAAGPVHNIMGIKYFMATMVINRETNQHIKKALSELTPPEEETKGWPGHEFSMDTDAGKALLGAPVGRWAGYFLMQHKRQLGGSKWISKVRVFKSEKEGSWPYLLFYVERPAEEPKPPPEGQGNTVVKRSMDGKSALREHVFRVKL
jgi:hypothetical protein